MKKNPKSRFFSLARKIYEFSKIFLFSTIFFVFPYFILFFLLISLIIYAEKPSKLKKAICSFIFLFFSQCSNFFLAVRTNFSQVHSEEKELALEPFGISRGLRPLEIPKLGSLANFFFLMNLLKIFLTARKNFLIGKREK